MLVEQEYKDTWGTVKYIQLRFFFTNNKIQTKKCGTVICVVWLQNITNTVDTPLTDPNSTGSRSGNKSKS